jgi:hypothetical protein
MAQTQSLASVATRGDHAATLRALRNKLAREIDQADSPRDVAALSARLVDVLACLAATQKTKGVNNIDQIAKKRAERQRQTAIRGSDAEDSDLSAGQE